MAKQLTVTLDDDVHRDLHQRLGAERISRFLNDLARERIRDPYVTPEEIEAGYRALAADEEESREAPSRLSPSGQARGSGRDDKVLHSA